MSTHVAPMIRYQSPWLIIISISSDKNKSIDPWWMWLSADELSDVNWESFRLSSSLISYLLLLSLSVFYFRPPAATTADPLLWRSIKSQALRWLTINRPVVHTNHLSLLHFIARNRLKVLQSSLISGHEFFFSPSDCFNMFWWTRSLTGSSVGPWRRTQIQFRESEDDLNQNHVNTHTHTLMFLCPRLSPFLWRTCDYSVFFEPLKSE